MKQWSADDLVVFVVHVIYTMLALLLLAVYLDALMEHGTGKPLDGLTSIFVAGLLANQGIDHIKRGHTATEVAVFGIAGILIMSFILVAAF